MKNTGFLGTPSYIYWTGIVSSRQDPLKIGRVQVRVHSWHTQDKTLIPAADLHWSLVPKHCGVIREGAFVTGYFMDAEAGQFPVVTGEFDGIPDMAPAIDNGFSDQRDANLLAASPRPPLNRLYAQDGSGVTLVENSTAQRFPDTDDEPTTSRLARNENIDETFIQTRVDQLVTGVTIAGGGTWDEPKTEYAARYPYDNVLVDSESGHVLEFDDTPGAERIQMAHRAGTFFEIFPDGTKVEKIVRPAFTIYMSDNNVYVMGKVNLTVQGDLNLQVFGNVTEEVFGDKSSTVIGDLTETVYGDKYTTVYGDINETTGGDLNSSTGGGRTESAALGYSVAAPTIALIATLTITETAPTIQETAAIAITRTAPLVNENIAGSVVSTVGGSVTTTVAGTVSETSSSRTMTAPVVNVIGTLEVNGIPVTVP